MRFASFAVLIVAALTFAQTPAPPLKHPDTVYAVAFSPDGKTVATGCFDKAARLWDAATGKELRVIAGKNGHQNLVVSVGFSADGSQLVTTSTDNFAKIWDIPTGKPAQMIATTAAVGKLTATADGKLLAAAGADGTIRLWTAADGKPTFELKGHTGPVVGIGFAANGLTLYSLGSDRTLRYWTPVDGKLVGTVGVGGGEPTGLFVNPANSQPYTASADGLLKVWPAALPPVPKALPPAPAKPRAAVLSADGTQFFASFEDQSVRAMNAASGEWKPVLEKLPAGDFSFAVHPTNGTIAAAADGKVYFGGPDGKPRGVLPLKPVPVAMAFHPSEPKFLSLSASGIVEAWPLPKPEEKEPKEAKALSRRPTAKTAVRAILLPAANQAVVVDAEGAVALWETADGKEAKEIRKLGTVGKTVAALVVSKDGTAVAAASGKAVKVWTLADGKELPFPALPFDATQLAFSADRSRLAIGFANNTAVVYATATGFPEQSITHAGPIVGLGFHPSQPLLYTLSTDKSFTATPLVLTRQVGDPLRFGGQLTGFANGVSTFSTGTGEGVSRVNTGNSVTEATYGKSKTVTAVGVNKAMTLIAVAEADGTVTVTNLNNPADLATFKATGKVSELAFHPTLPTLAGVLPDNRAVTWNVQFDPPETKPEEKLFGKAVQELPHPAAVSGLAFLGDGGTLLTGCADKNLRIWKFASNAPRFSLQHPNLVNAAAFNKEGTLLATGGQDGILRIYDLTKPAGTAPKAINAHVPKAPATAQPVYAVLFTADGKQVISASFDKTIMIHDATSGTLVKEIKPAAEKVPGHFDAVYGLALSPDGKLLASGSADRTVKLWNPATGELVREFKNTVDPKLKDVSHPGYVQAVKFTTDGTKLVTVGTAPRNKGYLAVWTVADGKQISGQELDIGPIHAVDVRADGLLVLGCASKIRSQSESEAVLMPLPLK